MNIRRTDIQKKVMRIRGTESLEKPTDTRLPMLMSSRGRYPHVTKIHEKSIKKQK